MGDLVFFLLKSLKIHLYNFHYSVNTFQALNRLWKIKRRNISLSPPYHKMHSDFSNSLRKIRKESQSNKIAVIYFKIIIMRNIVHFVFFIRLF